MASGTLRREAFARTGQTGYPAGGHSDMSFGLGAGLLTTVSRLQHDDRSDTSHSAVWGSIFWDVPSGGPALYFVTPNMTAVGTLSLVKRIDLFRSMTATGSVSLLAQLVAFVTRTFTATGTAALTALFVPFTAAVSAVMSSMRRALMRVRQ